MRPTVSSLGSMALHLYVLAPYEDVVSCADGCDLQHAIRQEFNDIREQVLYEQKHEVKTLAQAWRRYRLRVFVSIVVQSSTALTGTNVIAYCPSSLLCSLQILTRLLFTDQTTLYEAYGITGQTVLLLSAVYGTVGVIANIISASHVPV